MVPWGIFVLILMAPVLLKLKIPRIFISMKELLSTILLTFAVVFSYAQAPMDGGV